MLIRIIVFVLTVFLIECSNPLSTQFEGAKKIIITEIMYNNGKDSLEFIELKNVSSNRISLKGAFFSEGIDYSFPDTYFLESGEYCVLTNSKELFHQHYPAIAVSGVYSGHLDNEGDKIEIVNSNLKKICAAKYQNDGFWPVLADGLGYSLVTKNESNPGDQNDYNDWRASLKPEGTPGRGEVPLIIKTAYVNEIITSGNTARIDKVEIFNPDSFSSVDIGNWYLTDDKHSPKKYRIAANTIIQPLSYAVINAYLYKDSLFIGIDGGDIYLFSADANSNLTGFSNGFSYGESDPGTSFGLVSNSDGKFYPCQLSLATIGSKNALPVTGSVVISEIMYNPASSLTEFVEIANVSSDTVKLYNDDAYWKIGGISFTFSQKVSINPNGTIIIINNSTPINVFRTINNVDSSVTILQFSGKLSNDGELITLEKPGRSWVDSTGTIQHSYSIMDEVNYKDSSPWPKEADGKGYSLERIHLSSWGNDPANWKKSEMIGGTPGILQQNK